LLAATPTQAVRSFIAAIERAELAEIRGLLGDDLAAAFDKDWTARIAAIEKALEQPSAMEIADDGKRAELRYGENRRLALEQTASGWRIVALE
jgi:hypothetical protein